MTDAEIVQSVIDWPVEYDEETHTICTCDGHYVMKPYIFTCARTGICHDFGRIEAALGKTVAQILNERFAPKD